MRHTFAILCGVLWSLSPLWLSCAPKETSQCTSRNTLQVCRGDDCQDRSCRLDEICVKDSCRHWSETALSADFELSYGQDPSRVYCSIVDGGFPWERAQHKRFDFGDNYTGWGEESAHRYSQPGVYPVELEVVLEGYRLRTASRLAVIKPLPEGWQPLALTVNNIPKFLNGSLPYTSDNQTPDDVADDYQETFALLLPQQGFEVDLRLLHDPDNPVDRSSLQLVADVALADGTIAAGSDLTKYLRFSRDSSQQVPRALWSVTAQQKFPAGAVSLTLTGTTTDGASHRTALSFQVVELVPEKDPFDRPMAWLFLFDRDLYTASSSHHSGGVIALEATSGANGIADFTEELALIGGQGDQSATGASTVVGRGKRGANAVYLQWVKDSIVEEIYRFFHSAPDGTAKNGITMRIFLDDTPGAPDPGTFAESGDFSMMRFGGAFADYFGRSWVSAYNQDRVDNSGETMGVGTAKLLGLLSAAPVITDELIGIKPNTGIPVGQDPVDAIVLADTFDRYHPDNSSTANARYDLLARVAEMIGLTVGNVAAHEMGHALGLVPGDAPPSGFFGDRPDVQFMGSTLTDRFHADYPAVNLMQSGGNPFVILSTVLGNVEVPPHYDTVEIFMALGRENRLAHYSLAYLKRQLTYQSLD